MQKVFMKFAICLALIAFLFSQGIQAQTLTNADIRAQMVKDWERGKGYTIDYLNTMPADKYSFKAVDSIRSFAQQMLHLAAGNCFLMTTATDDPPPSWLMSDVEHRSTAQNKDSVMYYVVSSYDYCINEVKNTDTNKWGEKKTTRRGFVETRFALMNKAFEHQTHHRGQTTIYIRLQGIKPPEERLFER